LKDNAFQHQQEKGRDSFLKLSQRSYQAQASRRSHCLFTDPLGCWVSREEIPLGSCQQRCAFPAGEYDDPVDQRLPTGSL